MGQTQAKFRFPAPTVLLTASLALRTWIWKRLCLLYVAYPLLWVTLSLFTVTPLKTWNSRYFQMQSDRVVSARYYVRTDRELYTCKSNCRRQPRQLLVGQTSNNPLLGTGMRQRRRRTSGIVHGCQDSVREKQFHCKIQINYLQSS
jgi:hypothetical protein